MSDRPMLPRQRQPKGVPLKNVKAKVQPETYAWLNELAGDSSLGIVLDTLRERLSTHSGPTK